MKRAVLLVQLGTPLSPKVAHVRRYLREFLSDPRVVDLHPLLWRPILYLFVLPFRPFRSARAYARIWDEERMAFPLAAITHRFSAEVAKASKEFGDFFVEHAFLLATTPTISEAWDRLEKAQVEDILVVPLFPQYSESTVAAVMDKVFAEARRRVHLPRLTLLTHFHRTKAFVESSVRQIEKYWKEWNRQAPVDALVLSFHGYPKRRILYKGDPYYRHCFETLTLIRQKLTAIPPERVHMAFQSRFGREEWTTPATDAFIKNHLKGQRIAIYCPSFVVDCLENLDEIGHELAGEVRSMGMGGELLLIPALNDDPQWCRQFARFLSRPQQTTEESLDPSLYQHQHQHQYQHIPEQKMSTPPLSPPGQIVFKNRLSHPLYGSRGVFYHLSSLSRFSTALLDGPHG